MYRTLYWMPLDRLYNQFGVKNQDTNGTPKDKVNKKQIYKREKGLACYLVLINGPPEM